jgi:hypothetical protein
MPSFLFRQPLPRHDSFGCLLISIFHVVSPLCRHCHMMARASRLHEAPPSRDKGRFVIAAAAVVTFLQQSREPPYYHKAFHAGAESCWRYCEDAAQSRLMPPR